MLADMSRVHEANAQIYSVPDLVVTWHGVLCKTAHTSRAVLLQGVLCSLICAKLTSSIKLAEKVWCVLNTVIFRTGSFHFRSSDSSLHDFSPSQESLPTKQHTTYYISPRGSKVILGTTASTKLIKFLVALTVASSVKGSVDAMRSVGLGARKAVCNCGLRVFST